MPEDVVIARSCIRRGASIDLALDRGREHRSHMVTTTVRAGCRATYWQAARTTTQARPAGAIPRTRASGLKDLETVADSHDRYTYGFSDRQATTRKGALTPGDYGVVGDDASGKLKHQLATVPRDAVPVLAPAPATPGQIRAVAQAFARARR